MQLRTIPIFFTFFVMGVADAMGPLSDYVGNNFQLDKFTSTLLPFFIFIAFAIFSLPGGLLAGRIGKKNLLLLGLGLSTLGTLVPAVMMPSFAVLLACIFTLGVGTAFLQVAGNPIMRDVSPAGGYSRNLSFAQGFKGIGSTICTILVTNAAAITFLKSVGEDWRKPFPIYAGLIGLTFLLVAFLRVDETKADTPPSLASSLALMKNSVFLLAVLGIFLYVGAEVCMATFIPKDSIRIDLKYLTLDGKGLFFTVLTIGRLIGGAVLSVLSARSFFRLSALLGVVGIIPLMTGREDLVLPGVIAAGLGFANIWPLLFSLTVEESPAHGNELSGLMCMAISGGAIVPLLMGKLFDNGMGAYAFIVPVVCFVYLLALSLKSGRKVATN